jgi:uncharacterized membrane protein
MPCQVIAPLQPVHGGHVEHLQRPVDVSNGGESVPECPGTQAAIALRADAISMHAVSAHAAPPDNLTGVARDESREIAGWLLPRNLE